MWDVLKFEELFMEKKINLKMLSEKVNQLVSDTGTKMGETVKRSVEITHDVGQKTAVIVQKGSAELSGKMKFAGYQSRLKKYNPLFPEVYFSENFHVPNMIVIVDDAVRRGIDVCVGSIGWLGKAAQTEILYLYDEAVEKSGLTFVPMAQCDAVYYVDPFDRKRFIRTDAIFSTAHEEQVAELRHIAEKLGAKSCTIDIKEDKKELSKADKKVSMEEKKDFVGGVNEGYEQNFENHSYSSQKGRIIVDFTGSSEPQKPTLKWFAHNSSVKGLIDMRLSGGNMSTKETFEFSGTSTSAISQKAAYAIDSAISGMGVKGNSSIAKQMEQEVNKTMYFSVEF